MVGMGVEVFVAVKEFVKVKDGVGLLVEVAVNELVRVKVGVFVGTGVVV